MWGWRGKCTVAPTVRQAGECSRATIRPSRCALSHRLFPYFDVPGPDVLHPAVDLDPEVALEWLGAERLGIAVPHPVPDTGRQTVEKVGRVGRTLATRGVAVDGSGIGSVMPRDAEDGSECLGYLQNRRYEVTTMREARGGVSEAADSRARIRRSAWRTSLRSNSAAMRGSNRFPAYCPM
jgi:hypothetical protein